MFGCIAAQAQIIVVEAQPHMMSNRVRLEHIGGKTGALSSAFILYICVF